MILVYYLIPYLVTQVHSYGKIFDKEIYPPDLDRGLHQLLHPIELHYMFGTTDHNKVSTEEYRVVLLKNIVKQEAEVAKRSGQKPPDAAYNINIFGNEYNLRLQKVRSLLTPHAKIQFKEDNHTYTMKLTNETSLPVAWLVAEEEDDAWGYDEDEEDNSVWSECDNYILRSTIAEVTSEVTVEFSDCYETETEDDRHYYYPRKVTKFMDLTGIVFDHQNNETYEIYSVPERVQKMISKFRKEFNASAPEDRHVLVKKATFPVMQGLGDHETSNIKGVKATEQKSHVSKRDGDGRRGPWTKRGGATQRYVETGLFMDVEAYSMYRDYFTQVGYTNVDQRIVHLLLAFMNSIQAIYNFDSLGTKVDFSIVHLDIHKTRQFDNKQGDRAPMLTSFCQYQKSKNPSGDDNSGHWDIGLLVSGVDFWASDGHGGKSYLTMGLATVTGICTPDYGCVIGEMGVRDSTGKPYPSTGFTSVYVMAHEIGHNLGMSHDSSGNSCPSNGYIMSPSRGTRGETVWSSCSRSHMSSLDLECLTDVPAGQAADQNHDVYGNYPGQDGEFDGNKQCQMLMLTTDAHMDHTMADMADICYSLKCRATGRRGYYRAGPALEGTPCGTDKICHQGECVKNMVSPGVTNTASWSEWSASSRCSSGCITRAKGFSSKTRQCNKKSPVTINSNCPGSSTEVTLCEDAQCSNYVTPKDYASKMCRKFLKAAPHLQSKIRKHGYQPEHISDRVDTACTIHCQKPGGGWYAPVLELSDKMDVYFPDGTWCNKDGGTDYFCRKHQCLSSARGARSEKVPDLNVNVNARPDGDIVIPPDAEAYFSLDSNGKPKSNNFMGLDNNEVSDDAWEVKDYVEN